MYQFFLRLITLCGIISAVCGLNIRHFDTQVAQFMKEEGSTRDGTNHWAVLVAGSNTYSNYRHQADICHAYQILSANGIPDEQIIVMMYDDIAENRSNPKKGEIINHPDGSDVYAGVPKDYTGTEVTAKNFLNILSGADMSGKGSGKTLGSTSEDKVFIYYADHGATGLVAMPSGGYLYATDLMDTLKTMHSNNMYKELVFYMEACESGSMFQDLGTDMSIYATSASSATESSYACYYVSSLNTYVGDCYSVNWMEDSDAADIGNETLETQFLNVQKATTQSHVLEFGDLTLDSEVLQEFQSNGNPTITTTNNFNKQQQVANTIPSNKRQALSSRDVNLKHLAALVTSAENQSEFDEASERLMKEVFHRQFTDKVFSALHGHALSINQQTTLATNSIEFDACFKAAVQGVENTCGSFTDYSLKHVHVLHNACSRGIASETIVNVAEHLCSTLRVDIM